MRIDNVPEVIINEILLRPNDTIDFWFSGIHQNLTLQGPLSCPECEKQELDINNLTAYQVTITTTNIIFLRFKWQHL